VPPVAATVRAGGRALGASISAPTAATSPGQARHRPDAAGRPLKTPQATRNARAQLRKVLGDDREVLGTAEAIENLHSPHTVVYIENRKRNNITNLYRK